MAELSVCSIDWLQLYCMPITGSSFFCPSGCELVTEAYGTRQFKSVQILSRNNENICTIVSQPHSKIINPLAHIIKFENKYLYRSDLVDCVKELLHSLNLTCCSISRIDICIDFNFFANTYDPHNFICDYMASIICKLNKSKFSVHGEELNSKIYSYLAFGSKTSKIHYYLYNKTLQMQQVLHKPWINERHKLAGLNMDRNIWRLEFSLSQGLPLLTDTVTGEQFTKNNIDFYTPENVVRFISLLTEKYFQFKYVSKDTNKSRLKQVKLFDHVCTELNQDYRPNTRQHSRADKIFINKLKQLKDEDTEYTHDLQNLINEVARKYYNDRDMIKWLQRKNIERCFT